MPHWVELTKNGFNTEEFVKITDEVLDVSRAMARKHEIKLDGLLKRSFFLYHNFFLVHVILYFIAL